MELVACIEKIRSRAEQDQEILIHNETMTKNMLITPLLECLGWEMGKNIKMEEATEDNKFVDYSLYADNKLLLILEAKAMGNTLSDNKYVYQVAGYANKKGVGPYVLTNGILYKIYNQRTSVKPSDQFVYEVNLLSPQKDLMYIDKIVNKLKPLSKKSLQQNSLSEFLQSIILKTDVVNAVNELFADAIKGKKPSLIKNIREKIQSSRVSSKKIREVLAESWRDISWETDVKFGLPLPQKPKKEKSVEPRDFQPPGKMRIQTEVFTVDKFYEILVNTANWLVRKGHITASICPVQLKGSKRYLIHTEPRHGNGKEFDGKKLLGNDLFLNTNYSGPDCISNSRRLLKKYGYSESDLVLSN